MGSSQPLATEEVVENFESEEKELPTPAKKGEKIAKKNPKPPAIAMDLEVPAADINTAATLKVTLLLETDTDEEAPAPLPYSDPNTKYLHSISPETLESLKASWIGPEFLTCFECLPSFLMSQTK